MIDFNSTNKKWWTKRSVLFKFIIIFKNKLWQKESLVWPKPLRHDKISKIQNTTSYTLGKITNNYAVVILELISLN